jgi:hypothetical protein
MNSQKRHELVEEIRQAFAYTPYPSGQVLDEFAGKHWSELPIELIQTYRDDLGTFSSEEFRFYLPAYLIAIILHPDKADILCDNIIYKLSPPAPDAEESRMRWFTSKIRDFNKQEIEGIFRFVMAYKQLEPEGGWTFMEQDRETLERAITFWNKKVQE